MEPFFGRGRATADIAFDKNGDLTKGLLTIFKVKNGKWEVVSK